MSLVCFQTRPVISSYDFDHFLKPRCSSSMLKTTEKPIIWTKLRKNIRAYMSYNCMPKKEEDVIQIQNDASGMHQIGVKNAFLHGYLEVL